MSIFRIFTALFLALGITSISSSAKASCGDVTIAEMNWASAQVIAHIDATILEYGYGCDVELIPGDTMPTSTSLIEKGEPSIAPELWSQNLKQVLDPAEAEGLIKNVGKVFQNGGEEGLWVPTYLAEAEGLVTIEDALARPDLFPHPEDKSKGAFVGCPAGWGCQLANNNLFRAFDMEKKGWVLVDPGSAAGLDGSMSKAVERGQNWFGYYWSPTAMIGKYQMVPLPFGVPFGGKENWDGCIVKPEQECANPKVSAWTKSEVHTIVTDSFKKSGGDAVTYLSKRVIPGPVMNGMLVFMADEQAGGADAAIEFLKKHEAVWSKWVSSSAAAKIKKSL